MQFINGAAQFRVRVRPRVSTRSLWIYRLHNAILPIHRMCHNRAYIYWHREAVIMCSWYDKCLTGINLMVSGVVIVSRHLYIMLKNWLNNMSFHNSRFFIALCLMTKSLCSKKRSHYARLLVTNSTLQLPLLTQLAHFWCTQFIQPRKSSALSATSISSGSRTRIGWIAVRPMQHRWETKTGAAEAAAEWSGL